VAAARAKFPGVPVEVEVESFEELRSALAAKPEWIMLDNMPPAQMREAVAIVAGRCQVEASGGINLATIRAAAETGVDAISLGCLTHSVPAADLSLEIAVESEGSPAVR
jgi:nicotinate-nucleotide pyrophosphorylase (carboxylating)